MALPLCEVLRFDPSNVRRSLLRPVLLYRRLKRPANSTLLFVGTRVAAAFGYTRRACVIWYIYQEVAVAVLILSVEFILVIRGVPPSSSRRSYSLPDGESS